MSERRSGLGTPLFPLAVRPAAAVVGACSSSEAPAPPAPGASTTTYYEHVKPLVDEHCTQCHTQGGIAPFALTTFDDVSAHAAAIGAAVESRIMPPWPA